MSEFNVCREEKISTGTHRCWHTSQTYLQNVTWKYTFFYKLWGNKIESGSTHVCRNQQRSVAEDRLFGDTGRNNKMKEKIKMSRLI